jgi:predicted RNA-binding Zn ribbon-like protein
MVPTPTPPRFNFGGRLCLDLTWTLRHRLWAPVEHLTRDDDVAAWLTEAGVVEPDARAIEGTLEPARALRETIFRSVHHRIAGDEMEPADVARINEWASEPVRFPVLWPDGAIVWSASEPVRAGLAAVARDAAELLAGPTDRLRECSREGCASLYFDASPAGRRRWCSAERCGNATYTARYRRRTAPAKG